jgi:hypothetical protein
MNYTSTPAYLDAFTAFLKTGSSSRLDAIKLTANVVDGYSVYAVPDSLVEAYMEVASFFALPNGTYPYVYTPSITSFKILTDTMHWAGYEPEAHFPVDYKFFDGENYFYRWVMALSLDKTTPMLGTTYSRNSRPIVKNVGVDLARGAGTTVLTCKTRLHNYYDDNSVVAAYAVLDGDGKLVTTGASSSFEWVKHDAGGYHTKKVFDELYPDGWEVIFEDPTVSIKRN